MNEKSGAELAAKIARAIFKLGDEPNSPCQRIQFKGGKWPDNEINQGGIGEAPLANVIEAVLDEHLPSGDVGKLREALEECVAELDNHKRCEQGWTNQTVVSVIKDARAALASVSANPPQVDTTLDTPRTDEEFRKLDVHHSVGHLHAFHYARDFARQLERELAHARKSQPKEGVNQTLLDACTMAIGYVSAVGGTETDTFATLESAIRAAEPAAVPSMEDSPTWPHVLAFARRMEAKLAKNRHKGDRAGWLKDHPQALWERIDDEMMELYEALGGDDSELVANEAADVANFALMTADSFAARKEGGK